MKSGRNHARLLSSAPVLAPLLLWATSLAYTAPRVPQRAAAPAEKTPAPAQRAPAETPSGPGQAQKLELKGVPNFGRVTPNLYRGAQPKPEGYAELKKLGIEIVVNFRKRSDGTEAERRIVESLGLRYVSIPWSAWGQPENKQVAEFLELLRANPEKKIFVHCRAGADRTGVIVAAYRIAVQNWRPSQALAEMKAYHLHSFWHPQLKRYIEDFPKLLATDAGFRTLCPAAHTSPP